MGLLSNLVSVAGSRSAPKRLGRGRGSGLGQTSGKGHKGQLARTGGKVRRGFEGGQSPLARRMPKRGFSNRSFATPLVELNILDVLRKVPQGDITPQTLVEARFISNPHMPVKILGRASKALSTVDLKRNFVGVQLTKRLADLVVKQGGTVNS
ncbi:MAG: 50S ribosomal protein L15 [Bdellovibrionaceae bacterium]|nr:50S ribosomal protein L15 [Pseudobdellovibrionaceae bacterium]MDW8190885.1 50S ribosomal protein L15 [Pseudobdellovibrionaceae bacterium]